MKHALAQHSRNTLRGYKTAWRSWERWCAVHQVTPGPCGTPAACTCGLPRLSDYLDELAEKRAVGTVALHAAAVCAGARIKAHPAPDVSATLAGIQRVKGVPSRVRSQGGRQAEPLLVAHLRVVCKKWWDRRQTLHLVRDRALLLIGFAGAYRANELVRLRRNDVVVDDELGALIWTTHSKTDQVNKGKRKRIPWGEYKETCPVTALELYLELVDHVPGSPPSTWLFPQIPGNSLFSVVTRKHIAERTVQELVKRAADTCGLDARNYSSHSLRAGLITAARAAGKQDSVVMQQTGHKRLETLLLYDRNTRLDGDNAAGGIGL